MKKIKNLAGAVAVAALFPFSAAAEDVCAIVGEIAMKVMNSRQNGVPMSDAMRRITDASSGNEAMTALGRAIVLDAYAVSQYSAPENRKQAEIDFRNAAELACYNAG